MKPVHHSVRLPVALDKALRALAERRGTSAYAMLQQSVQVGIVTLTSSSVPDTGNRELVAELASVSTRMVDVERMLDRALFTACAAYCYARNAALGTRSSDDTVTAEINAAYDRQRRLSQETRP
ncbi:hypothetical protein BH10PSE12_BH10PSE12_15040 [soil metagenome]